MTYGTYGQALVRDLIEACILLDSLSNEEAA